MATKKRIPKKVSVVKAVPEVVMTPIPVTPVSVGSLQQGDQFELDGERYRRLFLAAGGGRVAVLHLTNPEKGWIGVRQTAFDPNTLVIKK
jgi:hypothetical protein